MLIAVHITVPDPLFEARKPRPHCLPAYTYMRARPARFLLLSPARRRPHRCLPLPPPVAPGTSRIARPVRATLLCLLPDPPASPLALFPFLPSAVRAVASRCRSRRRLSATLYVCLPRSAAPAARCPCAPARTTLRRFRHLLPAPPLLQYKYHYIIVPRKKLCFVVKLTLQINSTASHSSHSHLT